MRWVPIGLVVFALAAVVPACSGGSDDGAFCQDAPAPPVADEVSLHPRSDLAFVVGDAGAPAAHDDGPHHHDGPLVADGEPHLHYCVALTSGFADPLVLQAVQVLPPDGEEPLATVEAGALDESVRDGDVRIGGHETVELELLVPASEPHAEVRHRIAYTVEGPDGPQDLFSEGSVSADD